MLSDLLVGDLLGLLDGHAEDHLGQGGGGGDGAAAAKRLKLAVLNTTLGVQLEHQPQGVTAGQRADLADAVRFFDVADILWVPEVLLNLVGVVPHDVLLLLSGDGQVASPPESLAPS